MTSSEQKEAEDRDLFRDTAVRYLGYANEVGESFRSVIHVRYVQLSYAIASAYCIADSADKAVKAYKKSDTKDEKERRTKAIISAVDALVWQSLASVIIPGFTINRICFTSLYLLKRFSKIPTAKINWASVGIGLSSIPIIIKPIDNLVDHLLNSTLRIYLNEKVEK